MHGTDKAGKGVSDHEFVLVLHGIVLSLYEIVRGGKSVDKFAFDIRTINCLRLVIVPNSPILSLMSNKVLPSGPLFEFFSKWCAS
jgi:hypothetical protein